MVCAPANAGIFDHRRTAGVDLAALDFLAQIAVHFICDIDNKKEWQHFKLKRCHSVGTA